MVLKVEWRYNCTLLYVLLMIVNQIKSVDVALYFLHILLNSNKFYEKHIYRSSYFWINLISTKEHNIFIMTSIL
jgi:hypothetical protein